MIPQAADARRQVLRPLERGQEREDGVGIDGLDHVVIEARLAGEAACLVLGIAGDGNEQGVAKLGLLANRRATS